MPVPSEHEIQRAFHMWYAGVRHKDGTWKIVPARLQGVVSWHTPNGGHRDPFEGKRFAELGVLAGIPDYFMLWGALHAIEFKKPGGRLSAAQLALHPQLIAAGARVATVDNLDDAKRQAVEWGLTVC